jgi:multisubunit Na+/H+ antiporter MnhB subunit
MTRNDNDGDRGDVLAKLASVNPTVVVVATVALFIVILLLPDFPGGVLVLAIAAALIALLTRTWPVLASQQRVLRLVVIALLVVVGVSKVLWPS